MNLMAIVNLTTFCWALFGCSLIVLHTSDDWQATVGVLMVFQAFTGRLAFKRFRILKSAIFPDFLSLMLLYQFGIKILTMAGVLFKAHDSGPSALTEAFRIVESVPLHYQFQAELIFLLATIVFTSTWRLQERKRIAAVWHEPTAKSAWLAYGVGLIGYLALAVTGAGAGLGLVQELLRLFAIGALAALLAGSSAYALGKPRGWMPILAMSPLLLIALRSGMKSEVALVFFPLFIPIIRQMTVRRFGFILAFLIFTLLFIFPFSETWRQENWREDTGRRQQATVQEVAQKVTDSWAENGFLETAYRNSGRWLSRGSSSEQGGLVMSLADRDGFIGPILIEGLTTIFIPRFVWPDKPNYIPGAWFTWYLGHAESPETATTATAMMMPTELYWMFGLSGVVIGMGLIAVLYYQAWVFLLKKSRGEIVALLSLFALLARSSGMEEIHTIYAIASPVIFMVYVLIFSLLVKFVATWNRRQVI